MMVVPEGVKTCKRCGVTKPLTRFNPDKLCRDGRINVCKECRQPKPRTFAENFWSRVDQSGGPDACWPWTGACKRYGVLARDVSQGKKHAQAHRVAWELTNGPIPDGLYVLHHCDNPPCCNPAHLFLGTQEDNMRDCRDKGRLGPRKGLTSENAAKGERNASAKLTEAQVVEIRRLAASNTRAYVIAKQFDVTPTQISRIVARVCWKHVV